MPESINTDYEVSSEGAVRHWEIPFASLSDTTPTATKPAMVTGTAGSQLTGTILTVDNTDSIAVVDFTPSMVYRHEVRTVLTYAAGVEASWGTLDIGDAVYYDNSATMPAGVYLSTSPLNNAGTANPLFGWIVPADENDTFPKDAGAAGNTWECAVMQHGA